MITFKRLLLLGFFLAKLVLSAELHGAASITGRPLNYPNPFKQSAGTSIGYTLSQDAPIDLKVYNTRGNLVLDKSIPSGFEGAKQGQNTYTIPAGDFDTVSRGAYMYLIIADGQVIGRGKMAMI